MNILSVYKFLYSVLALLLTLGGEGFNTSVTFESKESKTGEDGAVFNSIHFKETETIDYWTMKQSHNGLYLKKHEWDHIEIQVHKSESPVKVSYHQYNNGVETSLKVNCFRCHSGGPRAIRPNLNSSQVKLNLKDQITIEVWNLKIKSYGSVKDVSNPWRGHPHFKEKLKIKSCRSCHYQGGPRSPLTKANAGSIIHLLKEGHMPPWPHKISKKDKEKLNRFLFEF